MKRRSSTFIEGAVTAGLLLSLACASITVEGFVAGGRTAASAGRAAVRPACSALAPASRAAAAARTYTSPLSLALSSPTETPRDDNGSNVRPRISGCEAQNRWRLKDMGPTRREILQAFSDGQLAAVSGLESENEGFVENRKAGCEGRGNWHAVRRGALRPAAMLRFMRKMVVRQTSNTGKGMKARLFAWRRAMSMAFVGFAAAALVLTAGAGSASAAGSTTRPKKRMTNMPEHCYQIREDIIELMQMDPVDRAIDFNDLTIWSEELDELDMFGDEVAVPYHTKESLRIKHQRVLEDIATGGKNRGILPALKTGALAFVIATAVGTVSFSVGWVLKSFLSMASEEEVHLYGEEISVDATEKPPDELEGLLPEDEIDSDEPPAAGQPTGTGDSPSPLPPPEGGAAGVRGASFPSEDASSYSPPAHDADIVDDDDDLLGL